MPERAPIKVTFLYANRLDGRGGIERQAEYLLAALAHATIPTEVTYLRTRYAEAGPFRHLTPLLALLRFIGHRFIDRPDIVHIHIARRGSTWRKVLFGSTAKLLGVKVLIHLHGSSYDVFFDRLPPLAQAMVRRFFQSADAVVVLGAHWQRFALGRLGVDPRRLNVIDNGAPEAPPSMKVGDQPPVISFVGAVGQRKGVDILLAACAELAHLPFELVLGGGGPELAAEKKRAASLGLGGKARFLGWIDEAGVADLLGRSAFFVLPSRAENQPVAIIEAMARGLPVIASDVGAIPEVVEDGRSGIVVPAGEPGALRDAMARMIEDPDLRRAMGERARSIFLQRYCISRNAERFAALYKKMREAKGAADA